MGALVEQIGGRTAGVSKNDPRLEPESTQKHPRVVLGVTKNGAKGAHGMSRNDSSVVLVVLKIYPKAVPGNTKK